MDSEDDIHLYANDDSSSEDDYSTSGNLYRYDAYDSDDVLASLRQKNYTILKEDDIRRRRKDDITRIQNVNNVFESWFDDEDKVSNAVGLLGNTNTKQAKDGELLCGICFESYPIANINITTAACGHPFCNTCWTAYISTSINDGFGSGCMNLRCPNPSCGVAVGMDLVNMLTSDEDKKKYRHYLLRHYVEHNRMIKWCPAPGCDRAIEFHFGSGGYDVTCHCSYNFCWNCTKEAHRPVDCETASKWIMKNSSDSESENMNWILANTKPCPKCKRPIEENEGFIHMTCIPPCEYEFCWVCLGQWSGHGESTGGFYACNRYESEKQEGAYDESECRRKMAKKSYTRYYERWATNEMSRQKALVDLQMLQTVHLARLGKKLLLPVTLLRFILEAWLQVVECRRVLKWTYVYAYYMPEQEVAKRQFFECLQGEAETMLERLYQIAEKELRTYLDTKREDGFDDFRLRLAGVISIVRHCYENLVKTLETGLSA